ncbi:hypothetical protein O6H91_Y158000 [Diphasiastrum complanatum]|nr:hypothetical protein O6H91_Y158000 [Diphasiastrum complanatum]
MIGVYVVINRMESEFQKQSSSIIACQRKAKSLEGENAAITDLQVLPESQTSQIDPQQVRVLEEKIQSSTKSWADLHKSSREQNSVMISQAMQEQTKREYKAQTICVCGISSEIDPLAVAKDLLSTLSYEQEDCLETAWRRKVSGLCCLLVAGDWLFVLLEQHAYC